MKRNKTRPRKKSVLRYPTMGDSRNYYSSLLAATLVVGNRYTIFDLASLIDVKSAYFTMKGGVISKRKQSFCLIMISLQKKQRTNPYTDQVIGNSLLWDSPEKDESYQSYIDKGYTFFVFIHDDNKTPYTYFGRAYPLNWESKKPGIPAKVSFILYDYQQSILNCQIVDEIPDEIIERDCVSEPQSKYGSGIPTTKARVVRTRTVQNKFRSDTLDLWNHRCAVSGVSEERILIASHIKPWCSSDDNERVDPHNGLILNPTYDKLFDLGFVTFRPDSGRIELSKQINTKTWENLYISGNEKLSFIPRGTENFLDYHNNCVFELTRGKLATELVVV